MMKFMARRKLWFSITGGAVILSLLALLFLGLNLGIDFTSGTLFWLRFEREVSPAEIRDVLSSSDLADLGLGKSMVQRIGDNQLTIRTPSLNPTGQDRVLDALRDRFGSVVSRGVDQVDPRIGSELTRNALVSVLIASLGILAYIAFRFEFRFGVCAVVALIHDVLITLGVLAITRQEINSPFVAGILTVVGYSVNDTIIVFDRIRENLRTGKKVELEAIVDRSIFDTLRRSINTAVTTLLAVVALFVFGSPTIRDFTLALMVGILAGTYSSIFVASPLWYVWKQWDRKRERQLAMAGKR